MPREQIDQQQKWFAIDATSVISSRQQQQLRAKPNCYEKKIWHMQKI